MCLNWFEILVRKQPPFVPATILSSFTTGNKDQLIWLSMVLWNIKKLSKKNVYKLCHMIMFWKLSDSVSTTGFRSTIYRKLPEFITRQSFQSFSTGISCLQSHRSMIITLKSLKFYPVFLVCDPPTTKTITFQSFCKSLCQRFYEHYTWRLNIFYSACVI